MLGSIKELIEIGEKAYIPVHAAHLKALGRDVWGQSGDIIALVAAARERGVDVTADQTEAMFGRLDNPDLQDRIREEMEANLWRRGGKDSFLVTGESEWRGMTLGEIAEQMDVEPVAAAVEVVRNGNPSVASFNMNPDDMSALAIQPWVMTGSDGSNGHPRKYASYPKAYRDLVVDGKLMPMEQFVHRSSGLVADSFSLCDRGFLQEGRKADLAVLQLEDFTPVADFDLGEFAKQQIPNYQQALPTFWLTACPLFRMESCWTHFRERLSTDKNLNVINKMFFAATKSGCDASMVKRSTK